MDRCRSCEYGPAVTVIAQGHIERLLGGLSDCAECTVPVAVEAEALLTALARELDRARPGGVSDAPERQIASKLHTRGRLTREESTQAIRRVTGELVAQRRRGHIGEDFGPATG